jgi:hypothetical protein
MFFNNKTTAAAAMTMMIIIIIKHAFKKAHANIQISLRTRTFI